MAIIDAIVQLVDQTLGDLFLVISCHGAECKIEVLEVEVVYIREENDSLRLDVDLIRTGKFIEKSASSLQVVTVFGTDQSKKIPEYRTKI